MWELILVIHLNSITERVSFLMPSKQACYDVAHRLREKEELRTDYQCKEINFGDRL